VYYKVYKMTNALQKTLNTAYAGRTKAEIERTFGISSNIQRDILKGGCPGRTTARRLAAMLNVTQDDVMSMYADTEYISHSRIREYKTCLKRYWFKYVCGIVPIKDAEALSVGKSYHEKVAAVLAGAHTRGYDTLADVMASAFESYIAPQLDVIATEKEVKGTIGGVPMVAYLDAVAKDGTPVEHKTTGATDLDAYIDRIHWDDQVSVYNILTGTTKVLYTVVRKPNIRQKKDESDTDFLVRCREWYNENTEEKIRLVTVTRTPEELKAKAEEIREIVAEMEVRKTFYRNPYACGTSSFVGCPYASICLDYTPGTQIIGFKEKDTDRNTESD